ncbi:MAG TPA: ceramide glucosyltransferase [Polyangiaceae bacterium]
MQALLFWCLSMAGVSLILTAVTHVSVLAVFRRTARLSRTPPISVLKPLKGDDDGLYENLVSLATQDYPCFEVLFGCEDSTDPALLVARRVQREFPHVRILLLSGAEPMGMNPKVNTLAMLAERARFDWLLISDSNVRARPDYLAAMASEIEDERVGLVSSVLVGTGERTLGARFDNLHMNSCVVRAVCGADVVASHPCVIGKSMLFRHSVLQSIGGFEAVKDVLAEDYVLARAFRAAGFRIALSAHPLRAISVQRTVGEFFGRHVRWNQMRRHLMPRLYALEPLQSPTPWLLFALAIVLFGEAELATWPVLAGILSALALRVGSDAAIAGLLRGAPLRFTDHGALLLKDVLFLAIWAIGAVKRTVNWRGNRMRIGAGSRLHPWVQDSRPSAALESV